TAAMRDESRFIRDAHALKRAVWDPLAPHLRDAGVVFVVPDGSLHLLNIATLSGAGNTYLIESGPTIHYLSTERDLVPYPSSKLPARTLLALGSPAFDDNTLPAPVARRPFRGERSGCGGFASMQFGPLPAAERETRQIVALWREAARTGRTAGGRPEIPGRQTVAGDLYLTGRDASEAAFKQNAPGRSVLHLATHGFFLGDRCPSALEPARGIGGIASADPTSPPPVTGENPLLLSGLALAGANNRRAAGPDEEDGILTAEEIAALDLADVEWAVLSACDTGAGEVQAGEGVLGLRRAFQVAGARTVIMSLWPVEDESARQWMQALYEGRLLKALSTAEAVREASLHLLRTRREKEASAHPFYWGAFVAAGDWR
ncbi:MAG: CHAT domain-containing protein, partial [Acidobacteria bacterium]|nr:CHAT domain-containing protein [Acidobacteriota bacterium]